MFRFFFFFAINWRGCRFGTASTHWYADDHFVGKARNSLFLAPTCFVRLSRHFVLPSSDFSLTFDFPSTCCV